MTSHAIHITHHSLDAALYFYYPRWLVEDYTTLTPLRIPPKLPTPLGAVNVIYTQELSLENFIQNRSAFWQ